ncbi:arginase family protein, partial [Pseudomonas sp. 5S1]
DPSRSIQIVQRMTIDDVMGFQVVDGRQANTTSAQDIARMIRVRVCDHPVYLTFDIDCLYPAFAPGTGPTVCGGLSTFHA